MKNLYVLLVISIMCFGCNVKTKKENKAISKVEVNTTESYELHKVNNSTETLVLFPGGANTSQQTKEEFDIIRDATESNISVLLMNFNRHIWINGTQTEQLASELISIFKEHNLEAKNVFIGGMSIGGNVALTVSNYLLNNKQLIVPKGVFIVDSPIDLYALYENSVKDVANPDFNEERLAEPKFIVEYFNGNWGNDSLLYNIQKVSPFTAKTANNSVQLLKEIKLRFYTEPDSIWWRENRQTDFKNTNAFMIQQIAKQLKKDGWSKVELIETKNKGFRANGDRHPHSWSIVDVKDLINWINNY